MNKWQKISIIFITLSIILSFMVVYITISNNTRKEIIILKDYTKLSSVDKNVILKNLNSKTIDDNYLFLGDSITFLYNLEKYYPEKPVVNSGIGGNKTYDILNDMNNRVYKYNPSKVFLLIGTNQLDTDSSYQVFESIKEIVSKIKKNRKYAKIYVESIYPVNKEIKNSGANFRTNKKISEINKMLKEYAIKKSDYEYIDVYTELLDNNGNLDEEYTYDGIHLNKKGYKIVTDILIKYM